MVITCEQCQGRIRIPDEKVPKNRPFPITCPRCKNKFSVAPKAPAGSPASAPRTEQEASTGAAALQDLMSTGYDASDRPFDFLEEGVETALICEEHPSVRTNLRTALDGMGYQTVEQTTAREALKQMRFHVFDVIVLNEHFDAEGLEDSPVLEYLNALAMSIRRRIFVTLVTERFRTMDNMIAFNKSVNLVVNLNDLSAFGKVLRSTIADHTEFYRVYKESLVKTGRV
jgi:predicted Zn finger-like uncharacterized protein